MPGTSRGRSWWQMQLAAGPPVAVERVVEVIPIVHREAQAFLETWSALTGNGVNSSIRPSQLQAGLYHVPRTCQASQGEETDQQEENHRVCRANILIYFLKMTWVKHCGLNCISGKPGEGSPSVHCRTPVDACPQACLQPVPCFKPQLEGLEEHSL